MSQFFTSGGQSIGGGKDWRQEEKGMTEDEMVGWHHQLDGHEFEQALGVGDGQGNLMSMGSQSRTWLSDWTELKGDIMEIWEGAQSDAIIFTSI